VKAGWKTKSLGELSDLITKGTTPTSVGHAFVPKGINFVKVESITANGHFIDGKVAHITREGHEALKRSQLKSGDILFSIAGALGRTATVTDDILPANTNQALAIIRLKNTPDVLTEFVVKALETGVVLEQIEKSRGGVAQQNLSLAQLGGFTIPLPPLPEQKRIVGILDKAFEGIAVTKANAEKNLENTRALFESYLNDVLTKRGEGWLKKPLSELCDIKHGLAFKSEFFASEGDYALLTPGNFHESGGYRDRREKQKFYTGEIRRDYVLAEGDLLVAMTEQAAGLLGSPIIVPESDKFLHNQRLGLVTKKTDTTWTNEFFFQVFNTKAVRKEIHDTASGVKVRHTSPTKIGEVLVSFPNSVSEQRAIVSELNGLLDESQCLRSLYERKLAALDALKKSLLHEAFTGQL
jgi:type I restriction enzyme S subunit